MAGPVRKQTIQKQGDWCVSSSNPISFVPRNHHKQCPDCGRIVSVIDNKIRPHKVYQNDKERT